MSSDFNDMEDYEGCPKNCIRHNIFEGMTDEEIKNLFNDKKEEKSDKKSNLLDSLKGTDFTKNDPRLKELIEKYTICTPDELVEKLSEYRPFTGDYLLNNIPYEDSLGYNPTEYPESNKALKGTKDLVKPEKDLDLNTLPPDEDDIPSGVNYGKCGGIKNDMNKPQLSLVPMQMVRDAALARMYGNNKYKNVPGYSSNNWCTIDKQRVIDALLRHILLYLEDMNGVDLESGLPHLCHVAANLSFLCEMQQPNWEEKKNKIIANDPILSKTNNTKEK